ncbi:MAG: DNA-binding protein [Moorea sp. SIO2B7]|nr:DNA-binding protein [Moorena sp. SIO2B7]
MYLTIPAKMFLKVKVLRFSILPLLLGGLIGCNHLNNSGLALPNKPNLTLTYIGELQQQQNRRSTVYLKGKVGNQAPFLRSGAYQLQDSTGSVWVITDQRLPTQGDEVLIEGKVEYQSILVEQQDVGELYVIELKQLEMEKFAPEQPQPQPKPTAKPVDDLFLPHKRNQ